MILKHFKICIVGELPKFFFVVVFISEWVGFPLLIFIQGLMNPDNEGLMK